ncbi:MAG: hypothetical protein AB1649_22615 [Chloroflexota bacterium]
MTLRKLGLLTVFLLAACAPVQSTPQSADPSPAPVFTAIPTLMQIPPTVTAEAGPPQTNASANTTAFDFVDQMCNALWTNSGQEIPCPTDIMPELIDVGYVNLFDPELLDLKASTKVLVTYPAQNEFSAIFGRFPAYSVKGGDEFYAHLGCIVNSQCDVEFALEYYDEHGQYQAEYAKWRYNAGEPMIEAIAELTPLEGQNVEFVLAVRPQSRREDAWAIWINPQIINLRP